MKQETKNYTLEIVVKIKPPKFFELHDLSFDERTLSFFFPLSLT